MQADPSPSQHPGSSLGDYPAFTTGSLSLTLGQEEGGAHYGPCDSGSPKLTRPGFNDWVRDMQVTQAAE